MKFYVHNDIGGRYHVWCDGYAGYHGKYEDPLKPISITAHACNGYVPTSSSPNSLTALLRNLRDHENSKDLPWIVIDTEAEGQPVIEQNGDCFHLIGMAKVYYHERNKRTASRILRKARRSAVAG